MPDTGAALLANVIAHPNDDAARLVYADWLEEQGTDDARVEAIRLGVRRRQLDEFDPESWVLDSHLLRIQKHHRKRWEAELPKLEPVRGWGDPWTGVEAGFINAVGFSSPEQLRKNEEVVFQSTPVTSLGVFIEGSPNAAALIAGCPYLDRLRSLGLGGVVPPEQFGLPLLARCPALAGLRELDLSSNAQEDPLLEELARCPVWPGLESINLYRNVFTRHGMRALARAPLLSTVRSLNLDLCIDPEGFRELLRSPYLGNLRRLDLYECSLGTASVRTMASLDWPHLESLNLASNALTPAALRHLSNSPGLSQLRSLDLSGNELGDAGAGHLAKATNLSSLQVLTFYLCGLGQRGLRALARAPWISNLTRLELGDEEMNVSGIAAFAATDLPHLRWLQVIYSNLDDNAVRRLLAAPWISHLTHLDLNNNQIGAAGARALVESPHLGNLVSLDLHTNPIPPAERDLLQQRFGDRVELKAAGE